MKKKLILGITLSCLCMLAACTKKEKKAVATVESFTSEVATDQVTTSSSSTPRMTTAESQEVAAAPTPDKVPLWDSAMAAALDQYMAVFSRTMNQQYASYTPGASGSFYGLSVPDAILSGQEKFVVGDKVGDPVGTIAWSKDGSGTAEYNLVAVYSDLATAQYMDEHLYFFVFHGDQATAMVTEQNQGMPDNGLHFHPTINEDLKTNFARIVTEGKTNATAAAKQKASTTNSAPAPSQDDTLKFILKNDSSPDLNYVDMGTGRDAKGVYRKVKVVSKSLEKQGGSGTLGFINVFSDGSISERYN